MGEIRINKKENGWTVYVQNKGLYVFNELRTLIIFVWGELHKSADS